MPKKTKAKTEKKRCIGSDKFIGTKCHICNGLIKIGQFVVRDKHQWNDSWNHEDCVECRKAIEKDFLNDSFSSNKQYRGFSLMDNI